MADKQPAPAAAAPAPAATPAAPAGGGSKKAMIIVIAVVLLEIATVGGTMHFAGGPKEAAATNLEADKETDLNRPVEVLVVKDKYPNMQTGRHLLYDTEIYITVRNRDLEKVKLGLEAIKAQTAMDIATIIRSAQPAFFQEPTLATIRRQVKAKLDDHLAVTMTYKLTAPAPAGGEGHGEGHEAKAEPAHAEAPKENSKENTEKAGEGVDTDKGSLVQDVLITRLIPFRAD